MRLEPSKPLTLEKTLSYKKDCLKTLWSLGMPEDHFGKLIIDRLAPHKAALVVVDVQKDFCHPQGAFAKKNVNLSHVEKSVVTLVSFLEKCRQLNFPIIFVRTIHSDWTDSPSWLGRFGGTGKEFLVCRQNSWGAEFYRVEPRTSDCIVTKHRFSGFSGTDLDLILKSKGIETLLISGVVTNVCVETTARDGFNLDYHIILIEDCCGAYFLEEHASTLNNIGKYFGIVTDSKNLIGMMGKIGG
jgi:ureidoacrylate peracid hydrolase